MKVPKLGRMLVGLLLAAAMTAVTAGAQDNTPPPCPGLPDMCPVLVTYQIGWNMVAGTEGNLPGATNATVFSGVDGPLYTLQARDADYQVVSASAPLAPGRGYWAHFTKATLELIAQVRNPQPVVLSLPAAQFVMIGDPFSTSAAVNGGDVIDAYDPLAGTYQQTNVLHVGQGAWAYSTRGENITLTPSFP